MTLGVLAPYRGCGIGSALTQRALHACSGDDNIADAYLHVHVSNEEAIEFYRKLGFQVTETIERYYKRLEPPHAVVLSRPFQHTQ